MFGPSTGRRRFLQAGAATLAATAGCAALPGRGGDEPDGAWPQPAHDARNTGHAGVDGPGGALSLDWTWTTEFDGKVREDRVLYDPTTTDGERVYTGLAAILEDGTGVNAAVALDPDGSVAWRRDLDPSSYMTGPHVVDGGRVFHHRGEVRALATDDGSVEWTVQAPVAPIASPTVHDGTLYLAGNPLTAIAASDGTVAWEAPDVPVTATPAVTGDAVFAAAATEVVAVETDDGTVRWRGRAETTSERIAPGAPTAPAAPVVGTDVVYAATEPVALLERDAGELTAFDRTDGSVAWSYRPDAGGIATGCYGVPAFDGDTLYVVATADGTVELHAVNTDGSRVWTADLPGAGATVVAGETAVYVVSQQHAVAFDAGDGTRLAATAVGGGETRLDILAHPALTEGTLYTRTEAPSVVAFGG